MFVNQREHSRDSHQGESGLNEKKNGNPGVILAILRPLAEFNDHSLFYGVYEAIPTTATSLIIKASVPFTAC